MFRMPQIQGQTDARGAGRARLVEAMSAAAEPLADIGEAAFAQAFDRFGDARVVLLGAATEGSAEFHAARAAITRWLIEHRGFSIVALETDWADARVFDAYVRGREPPNGHARGDDGAARFPAWRWRNAEFLAFLESLRTWNAGRGKAPAASVYGLDIYNLAGSMRAVIDYLDRLDPGAAELARRRFGGLTPWGDEPAGQGRTALTAAYARHEKPVVATLTEVLGRQARRMADEGLLNPEQAARLARGAEAHYQAMYRGGVDGWNLRATHMLEVLDGVLARKGADAKAVVWAHNAHAGDAQATEMGAIRHAKSLGGLCRAVWDREAALIGLGTHSGTLACAADWDTPLRIQRLHAAPSDSLEGAAHATRLNRFLVDLRPSRNEPLRATLSDPLPERFIGPVYRPETERWSHSAECRPAQQFDAWVWFDETRAVSVLPVRPAAPGDEGAAPPPWPFAH